MVFQECAEVFRAVGGEEEGVDSQAQVLEGFVGGGEDGDTLVCIFEGRGEAGFEEGEGEGAEVGGDEVEEVEGGWGWEEDGVDAVD